MTDATEVRQAIENILLPYADCIAWEDMGDNGNPCYDPYHFDSPGEQQEAAKTVAAVLLAAPKGSRLHLSLAQKIAEILGNKYITYPWFVKAVSRVLAGNTYSQLLSMARLSRLVRSGIILFLNKTL